MAAFYDRWTGDTGPAAALADAQAWLRDATNGQIHAAFPSGGTVPADGTASHRLWAGIKPYQLAYYWAGFAYSGL